MVMPCRKEESSTFQKQFTERKIDFDNNGPEDLMDEGNLDSFATPDLPDEIEYNFNGESALDKVTQQTQHHNQTPAKI